MQKFSKKKLSLLVVTVGIVIVGISAIMYKNQSTTGVIAETIPLVRTQVIGQLDSLQNYSYSGEVRGRFESQLAFQIPGKIIKRNVEAGTVVKPGDVLMQVDGRDMQEVAASGQAQVLAAEAQLKLAANNLERYKELYAQNVVSRGEYDRYVSACESAEALVMQARTQYNTGTNKLAYSNLLAESSGVIGEVNAEVGQVVGAGQKVMTIVSDNEMEIEINVAENRLQELKNAKNIKVDFWALADIHLNGKIREISPIADKNSRTYKVRISLLNPPEELRLGMTAKVTIDGNHNNKVITIPLSAIYQTNDTPSVWIVNNGMVQLQTIKIGTFGDNQVQVLAGLKEGDRIVTAGVHKLQAGQKIRTSGDANE